MKQAKVDEWRNKLNRASVMCTQFQHSLSDLLLHLQTKQDTDYTDDERVKITARLDILLSELSQLTKWPAGELKALITQRP